MQEIKLFSSGETKVGLCDLTTLQLSAKPTVLSADLSAVPAAARVYLRFVNAADCRRNVRFEVQIGSWRGSQAGRVMAAWESFLLELPRNTPRSVTQIGIRAVTETCSLVESLRPSDPLPSVVMHSHQLAPRSSILWVATSLPPSQRALQFLRSSAAFDYLGWMTGCTTTALALLDQPALEVRFSGVGEGLPLLSGTPFELSTADEGNIAHLESFAPLAALAKSSFSTDVQARLEAAAPQLLALCLADLPQYTSEGCFTLAYPLACIANRLEQPQLLAAAEFAVLRRWEVLLSGSVIAQRCRADGAEQWMEHWARGTAWLVLGTALVALEMPAHAQQVLVQKLVSVIPMLLEQQLEGGLWSVFTDRADTGAESSGSAGIAAALAIAVRQGWLAPDLELRALMAARACAVALEGCVDADGCLNLVSQHNPAGEQALQIGHRMRAAWGTGLYAILLWALEVN